MRKLSQACWSFVAATCALLSASTAQAINFPEVEPNETKAQANIIIPMQAGDTITGTTTGTSTTVAGAASADTFRICPATPPFGVAKYCWRLRLRSPVVGHTMTIRGLNETAGVPGTTTTTTTTTPPSTMTAVRPEPTPPAFVIDRVRGGLSTEALDYVFRRAGLETCTTTGHGAVPVTVSVDRAGHATASVARAPIRDAAYRTCVQQHIVAATFPAASAATRLRITITVRSSTGVVREADPTQLCRPGSAGHSGRATRRRRGWSLIAKAAQCVPLRR